MPPWFPTYCGHIVTCIVLLSVLQMFCSYLSIAQFPSPSEPLLMFTSNVTLLACHSSKAWRSAERLFEFAVQERRTFIGSKRSSQVDKMADENLLAIFVEELLTCTCVLRHIHAFKTAAPAAGLRLPPSSHSHKITTMISAQQSNSRAGCLTVLIIACYFSYTQAFQSTNFLVQRVAPTPQTSALLAEGFGSSSSNNNNGKNNKKKGKKPKYTIEDKSYGSPSPSSSSSSSATEMFNTQTPEEFFTTYNEWMPLFQQYKQHSLAHSFLTDTQLQQPSEEEDTLWGISTLENRNPWRLLPSKPELPEPLSHIGTFLDEWQRSLLDIPIDTLTKEEDIGKGNNDLHFLEEGRRVIAVTRFHVLDGDEYSSSETENNEEWEMELFRVCWSEMGKLMSEDLEDTGSLVVLPNTSLSLEHVQQFVETKLVQPAVWMGRGGDWEIVAMERGNLGVRLLYKLGAIPDLSEKYSPEDDE